MLILKIKQAYFKVLLGFCLFILAKALFAHGPAKTVMYPADVIYKQKGLQVPELSDDVIAVINSKSFKKKDYKRWLYEKVGYKSDVLEKYRFEKYLRALLKEKGREFDKDKQVLLSHLYKFETLDKLYSSAGEWGKDFKSLELSSAVGVAANQNEIRAQFIKNYLNTFYIGIKGVDEYKAMFERHGVFVDKIQVSGNESGYDSLMQLNNAYYLAKRFQSYIEPSLRSEFLEELSTDESIDRAKYIEWLYKMYHTDLYTENFLSMHLIDKKSKEKNILVDADAFKKLYDSRLNKYKQLIAQYNAANPMLKTPLSVTSEYLKYLGGECRIDLLGSRLYRLDVPLKDYEILKRFYDSFGYEGLRFEVYNIFKWVRKKTGVPRSEAFDGYLREEEEEYRSELKRIRKAILAGDASAFPVYAMVENSNLFYQRNGGYYGEESRVWPELSEALQGLKVYEISPVLKSPFNSLHIFWLAEIEEGEPRLHQIVRELTPNFPFDVEDYKRKSSEKRKELEQLMERIQKGESIEQLAKEHSDSFRMHGSDISGKYQDLFGFAFAKGLSEMKEGELKIITSPQGLQLVQLKKVSVTKFTEGLKGAIIGEYNSSLATENELNALSKSLLYEADPYF